MKTEAFVVDFTWEQANNGAPLPAKLGLRIEPQSESESSVLHALMSQSGNPRRAEAVLEWDPWNNMIRVYVKGAEPAKESP